MGEIRPVLPFRVHFADNSIEPLDVKACDAAEARKHASKQMPGAQITKIKIVREKI